jgi:hypothetical protein
MEYLHQLLSAILDEKSPADIFSKMTPAQKGHLGEAMLRILTLLGIHPTNPTSTVIPYKVIPASRRVEKITDIGSVLLSGKINSGGSNKIDVCWKDGDHLVVCSSKIGMEHITSLDELEILPMLTEFTESGGYTEDGIIIERESVVPMVLVPSSDEVLHVASRSKASTKASKDNLCPLDVSDLTRMCAILCQKVKKCSSKKIPDIVEYLCGHPKPMMRMRFHQFLITNKVNDLISREKKTILIGCLPRSGKTWIGAYIAQNYDKVLVITTRPSETRSQWSKVFTMHNEFNDYKVMDITSKSMTDISVLNKEKDAKMVAIASIQFFKMAERESLKDLSWDIVLLDEIHEGGSTELSEEMLMTYITNEHSSPVKILMTATYTKPVEYYNVPMDACCFWDLEDVRIMRSWGVDKTAVQRMVKKYSKKALLEAQRQCFAMGETEDTIRESYLSSPSLGIMTTIMQKDVYEQLQVLTKSESVYGFSMKALFMPTRDGKYFQYPRAVDKFLELISGSSRITDYPRGDMSMMTRIRNYWNKVEHRDGESFMTQLWFLPYGIGQLLDDVKHAMISRIEANKQLCNFATMTLDSGMKDIAWEVSNRVKEAKASGKEGLIILTGNVGSLGVSLPEVDVAFMMHDIESADMTYQQMMRVLTEQLGKKCGLVVDFNVWRVLSTLNTYATSRCGQTETSSEERIRWCLSHLIDVDPDLWCCDGIPPSEKISKDTLVDRLSSEWRKMLEHTGTSLLRLSRRPLDLGEDQSMLDRLAKYIAPEALGKSSMKVNEDSEQEKQNSGIQVVTPKSDSSDDDDDDDDDTDREIESELHVNLNEILSRLIPELSLLSGCSLDMKEAIDMIETHPEMMEALEEFFVDTYAKKS